MSVPGEKVAWGLCCALIALMAFSGDTYLLSAQTTVGTGSIVGTVSDPSGAIIIGAKVTIIDLDTRPTVSVATNSSGSFNSGALLPGNYKTLVSARISQLLSF